MHSLRFEFVTSDEVKAAWQNWSGGKPDHVGANFIVIDQARRMGVAIDWRTHLRVGVPVTLATLAIAAVWRWLAA